MRKLLAVIMLAFAFKSGAAETAQPKKKGLAAENASAETLPQSRQSKVSFSGLKLQGQLKKPDLSYIYKRRGLKAEQIVTIPEDFDEEIAQGAGRF